MCPLANFNGVDSFTYRANDGGLSSATATVTLCGHGGERRAVGRRMVGDGPTLEASVPISPPASDVDRGRADVPRDGQSAARRAPGAAAEPVNCRPTGFLRDDTFAFVANDGTVDSKAATGRRDPSGSCENRAPEAEDQWIFIDEDTPTEVPLLPAIPKVIASRSGSSRRRHTGR